MGIFIKEKESGKKKRKKEKETRLKLQTLPNHTGAMKEPHDNLGNGFEVLGLPLQPRETILWEQLLQNTTLVGP